MYDQGNCVFFSLFVIFPSEHTAFMIFNAISSFRLVIIIAFELTSNEGEWISYAGSRGRNNKWNLHTQRNINTEVYIYIYMAIRGCIFSEFLKWYCFLMKTFFISTVDSWTMWHRLDTRIFSLKIFELITCLFRTSLYNLLRQQIQNGFSLSLQ